MSKNQVQEHFQKTYHKLPTYAYLQNGDDFQCSINYKNKEYIGNWKPSKKEACMDVCTYLMTVIESEQKDVLLFREWKEKNYMKVLGFFDLKDTPEKRYLLTMVFLRSDTNIKKELDLFVSMTKDDIEVDQFVDIGGTFLMRDDTYQELASGGFVELGRTLLTHIQTKHIFDYLMRYSFLNDNLLKQIRSHTNEIAKFVFEDYIIHNKNKISTNDVAEVMHALIGVLSLFREMTHIEKYIEKMGLLTIF